MNRAVGEPPPVHSGQAGGSYVEWAVRLPNGELHHDDAKTFDGALGILSEMRDTPGGLRIVQRTITEGTWTDQEEVPTSVELDPDSLLEEWFDLWARGKWEPKLPKALHVRTAVYLTRRRHGH